MVDATPYLRPRRIWVEDGHVFAEGHDGTILVMTPEVAIDVSRSFGEAGSDALINKVLEESADRTVGEAGSAP